MTWSAPMTAIAGSVFTAAQFNTFVRDNLNECPTAKTTTAGSIFVGTGTNQLAEQIPTRDAVTTGTLLGESTTSTSYTNLATPGPTVTVATQTQALVCLYAQLANSTSGVATWYSYAVSGATTLAPDDGTAILMQAGAGVGQRVGATILQTGLTPGINTFTAQYKVGSGTGSWNSRRLAVLPL